MRDSGISSQPTTNDINIIAESDEDCDQCCITGVSNTHEYTLEMSISHYFETRAFNSQGVEAHAEGLTSQLYDKYLDYFLRVLQKHTTSYTMQSGH